MKDFYQLPNPSGYAQPLTEMNTRDRNKNFSGEWSTAGA
jgi:hypothetical protein